MATKLNKALKGGFLLLTGMGISLSYRSYLVNKARNSTNDPHLNPKSTSSNNFDERKNMRSLVNLNAKEVEILEERAVKAKKALFDIQITKQEGFLTSESITQVLSCVLDIFFPVVLHRTTEYRYERRKNYENIEAYAKSWEKAQKEIAQAISSITREAVEKLNIDKGVWMKSIMNEIGNGNEAVADLTFNWSNVFEKSRIPSKQISPQEYKKMLEIFVQAFDTDTITQEISHTRPPDEIYQIKLHRAWDEVFFKLNLEAEDMITCRDLCNDHFEFINGKDRVWQFPGHLLNHSTATKVSDLPRRTTNSHDNLTKE